MNPPDIIPMIVKQMRDNWLGADSKPCIGTPSLSLIG